MMKKTFIVIFAALIVLTACTTSARLTATDDSSQFVTLTDAVPDAILEIRYFSTYNFVGTRIDGYQQPTALLTRRAADSLRAVSDELKQQGYRLKIYDAYRPQRAVNHFVRWASDLPDTAMKPYFYPDLDKSVLFEQDYIAEKSGHTRGSTVDLTLFDMASEKEVDMGGTFDWFGPESHPDFCGNPEAGTYTGNNSKSPTRRSITAEQFRNRMILRNAMLRHGFKPIDSQVMKAADLEKYAKSKYGDKWLDAAMNLSAGITLDKNESLTYQQIIEAPGKTKEQLYLALNYWATATFKDNNAITLNDKDAGCIIISSTIRNIAEHMGTINKYSVSITPIIRMDIKDGKVRVTYTVQTYDVLADISGGWLSR